ncbi:cupin domain-containing protein [Streptomyces sp. NPDC057592]|uniref:cupin domain-containing protein n=1 Tax=unclassified Streptomyces TaxID=2593676 RepID=UPI0036C6BECE
MSAADCSTHCPRSGSFSAIDDDPLREVITLLSRDLVRTEPAQKIVLDRLLDLLLVLAIRSDFAFGRPRCRMVTKMTGPGSTRR